MTNPKRDKAAQEYARSQTGQFSSKDDWNIADYFKAGWDAGQAEMQAEIELLKQSARPYVNERAIAWRRQALRLKAALEKCETAAGRGAIPAVRMWAREALREFERFESTAR